MQVQLHLGNTGILVQVNTVCHEKERMSRKKVATGEKQQSGQCHQVNALRSKQTYEITSHRNTTCFSPTNFHHHNTTDNVLLAFFGQTCMHKRDCPRCGFSQAASLAAQKSIGVFSGILKGCIGNINLFAKLFFFYHRHLPVVSGALRNW